jgi:transmembrane sensor
MNTPADWEALARYLDGESSPEEARQIEAGLSAKPADRELLDALATVTSRMANDVPSNIDVEAALQSVKSRRESPAVYSLDAARKHTENRRPRWIVSAPAIAAAAILAIGVAGYLALRTPGKTTVQQAAAPSAEMIATGVGALDSLRLPDGTYVVLGPLSSIKVASGFGTDRREVELHGDVYLEVVHDSSKPFTARANGVAIQDIGTKFAVHSDSAHGVTVSVTEGSVSLQGVTSGRSGGVVLRPGERGIVLPGQRPTVDRSTPDDMAWMKRQLVFRETPLTDVAVSLRRWYGIQLSVRDPSLANRHLTASFAGEPAERVLDVIGLVLGADIERRGDTAIVRAKR